ncbi:MAG: bacteriohemerythrin [Acidobacteria bacterium]|nr:bacteriohemerythrin [Acidobacteriota bacterium]
MSFIEWRSEFSVGVQEIDTQHRRLLDIINQMHEAMKMGGKAGAVTEVINDLIGYTRYHFAYEEKLLEGTGYPELEEHRRKHRAMVAQVEAFRSQAKTGSAAVSLKLMGFLKDWLTRHILETDKRYSAHLTGYRAA